MSEGVRDAKGRSSRTDVAHRHPHDQPLLAVGRVAKVADHEHVRRRAVPLVPAHPAEIFAYKGIVRDVRGCKGV